MSVEHVGQFNVSSDLTFAKGILLLDDCEGAYNWANSGSGADFTGSYEAAAAFFGGKGMQLKTQTSTPASGENMQATRRVPLPESGLVVWRTRIGIPDVSIIDVARLRVDVRDSVDVWNMALEWDPSVGTCSYLNEAGSYTAMAELAKTASDGIWTIMEMVVNLTDKVYVSAMLHGIRVDLSDIPYRDGGSSADFEMSIAMRIENSGAASAVAYFDSLYCGEYKDI